MCGKVVTVTLNPAIDITLMADSLEADIANRVMGEMRQGGGKGINVSRVVDSFGVETVCICLVGNNNAREFAEYLKEAKLKYDFVEVGGAVRENLMIRCGDRSIKLNRKGPSVSGETISSMTALIKRHIREGDIVVFGGSLPENMPVNDYVDMIVAVKNCGVFVVVDSDCLSAEDYRRISPWLMKPNIHELKNIVSMADDSPLVADELSEYAEKAAKLLCESGVENVLVSLGGNGVVYVGGTESVRARVPQVEVKSTVGAGDSTVAGFIAGFLLGYTPEERIRLAAACGTATVMLEGTMLTDKKAALEILYRVKVGDAD